MKKLIKKIIAGILAFVQCYVWGYERHTRWRESLYTFRALWLRTRFKQCPMSVHFKSIGMLNGMECIAIGENTVFGKDVFLTAWPKYRNQILSPQLTIGCGRNFGAYNHITCANVVIIGDNCLTGKWVTITDNSHGDTDDNSLLIPPSDRPVVSKGAVVIDDDVWLGDKVTILPNVTIGKGAVVAANSVVTKDVPPLTVVAGIPARIIK